MEGVGGFASVVAIGILVAIWCGWRVLNWIWFQPKKLERILKKQGFNMTPYKILFGDVFEMGKMHMEAESKPMKMTHQIPERVVPWNTHVIQKYGKMSGYWVGNAANLNIMDPGLTTAILNENFQDVSVGVFNFEGEHWATHRRIINPAFHMEKLKHMSSAITTSLDDLTNKLEKVVPSEGCSEVDIWPHIDALSADIISRTLFGSSFEEGKRIFQLQHEQAQLVIVLQRSIYLPGFRFLPTKTNRKMHGTYAEVRKLLRDLIDNKTKALKAGVGNKDLLSLLLESYHQDEGKVTMDDLIEDLKVFYFAGQETSATLMTWTLLLLSLHPEWQVRAREEVFQVFGNEKPHWDRLNQLKIIPMILLEVLRLYPPAAGVFRYTLKDFKYEDITIPPGVTLVLPPILIHHDRESWGNDVDEFKPERFAGGVAKATNNKLIYYPFGFGHRLCIGQQFAMTEAKMSLSTILQRFSFEPSPYYEHAPVNHIALRPQRGVQLMVSKVQHHLPA